MDPNNVQNLNLNEHTNYTSETEHGDNIKQAINRAKCLKRESSPRPRVQQHHYRYPGKQAAFLHDISPERHLNSRRERKGSPSLSRSSSITYSVCSSNDLQTKSYHSIHLSPSPARSFTPRRTYPQSYSNEASISLKELNTMDPSSTVFNGRMSFMIGNSNQRIYQQVNVNPAHKNPKMASNYLSSKIDSFLKRTDHVMEEWKHLGKRDHSSGLDSNCSKSSANIMIKGFQMMSSIQPTERMRNRSLSYDRDDDCTITDGLEELSEATADLTEERSAFNIANEGLEKEIADRKKIMKDVKAQEDKIKYLQDYSDKLEMDLITAKTDLNGLSDDDDVDIDESSNNAYKIKYDRAAKELDFTRRRMQTQHEHDLEQLVSLKKQLEKKLADAYEEVEEQRRVVDQWKRKMQKSSNEMNDLRMLLEVQNGRNDVLEKRQKKFDSECQSLQEAFRQETLTKDRISRERDILLAEKFTLEQNITDLRLELEFKDDKLSSVQKELEEIGFSGETEAEVTQIKRTNIELLRKYKEQEEELDEMAGQIQLLEQGKTRLEMSLETLRKEGRRDAQQRDDELEEVRGNFFKKIKCLESQLETEHEERTLMLREKHDLERRYQALEHQEQSDKQSEEATILKLKKDLRRYKALLKDLQSQLERSKADTPGKLLIRKLRNQLEDSDAQNKILVKNRQTLERELAELQSVLDDALRSRTEAKDLAEHCNREKIELQTQLEENEDELSELMKKYGATVKQLNIELAAVAAYEIKVTEAELERCSLRQQIDELNLKLDSLEIQNESSITIQNQRQVLRVRELESKLEFEQATRARFEVQCNRYKDSIEKTQIELQQSKIKEVTIQDTSKKFQKNLRTAQEQLQISHNREQDHQLQLQEKDKQIDAINVELNCVKNDLRLALQRIFDLQEAMEGCEYSECDSDLPESSDNSLAEQD